MFDCTLIYVRFTIMIKKKIIAAMKPTTKFIFTTSTVPLKSFRLTSNTLSIFYVISLSGLNLISRTKFTIPQIIERPPIVQVKTIKVVLSIGARPSGVDDWSIVWDYRFYIIGRWYKSFGYLNGTKISSLKIKNKIWFLKFQL